MKLANIHIQNFKALRDVSIPLSNFVCLTGENNAGKSSALQALVLFMSPTKLDSHHFFDATKEITITVTFSDIEEADWARFNPEPREKLRALVKDGKLELTRRFVYEGEIELGYYSLQPKDSKFSKDNVDALLKGKKGKPEIKATLEAAFPGIAVTAEISSGKAAKELIEKFGESLPAEEKEIRFKGIPTGADFSINPLLPEDIYIPAVKDLKEDVSSKQGSSFGKVLGILMGKIESKLTEEKGLFDKLRAKLTRIEGVESDGRIEEIIEIESTIQKFVRESFASIDLELEIPPPELKTVLSTARIYVNDGTKGPLDFKGDGLRRAVVFAILRTYVELVAKKKADEGAAPEGGETKPSEKGYVLLFEEPELFLHPDAQKILFEALRVFSKQHHVIVTTHSPIFLGPGAATFVRMAKHTNASIPKPFSVATPVDLNGLNPKDEFQLICFENNNAALFSKKVVLVEGDSEMIVFPHIASQLNADWSCAKHSVSFVQAKGKGSIQRYRSFFQRFGLQSFVIVDLDVIPNGFDKLDPTVDQQRLRDELIRAAKLTLPTEEKDLTEKQLKDANEKGSLKALWNKARTTKVAFDADSSKFDELSKSVQDFFDWEIKSSLLDALENPRNAEVAAAKTKLLESMRESSVFILSKGAIESYYPSSGVSGRDKPSKAQSYRNIVVSREAVISNCPEIEIAGQLKPELEIVCEAIFTKQP